MRTGRWATHHPVLAGLLIGSAFAAAAAIACGLAPHVKVAWPLVALALTGFGRRPSFQAAVLSPVCIVTGVLSALEPMAVIIPAVAALASANIIARTESGGSFTLDHVVYTASGFIACFAAFAIVIAPRPSIVSAVYTGVVLALIFALAITWRIVGGIAPAHREISFSPRSLQ